MEALFLGTGNFLIVLLNLFARTERVVFASSLNVCSAGASFSIQKPFFKWWFGIWVLMKNNFEEKPLPAYSGLAGEKQPHDKTNLRMPPARKKAFRK